MSLRAWPPSAPLPARQPSGGARPLVPAPRGVRVALALGSAQEALGLAPIARIQLGAATVLDLAHPRAAANAVLEQLAPDAAIVRLRQRVDTGLASAASRVHDLLSESRPEWLLLQGASAGAWIAARAARAIGIPIAHLGGDERFSASAASRRERALHERIAALADLHLVHAESARRGLLSKGVGPRAVRVVADPGVDALAELLERASPRPAMHFTRVLGPLLASQLEGFGGRLVLLSAQRKALLPELANTVRSAAARHPDWLFAWPLRRGDSARARVRGSLGSAPNVVLCNALDLESFAWLLGRCDAFVTDSAALQRRAAALGKNALLAVGSSNPSAASAASPAPRISSAAVELQAALERTSFERNLAPLSAALAREGNAAEDVVRELALAVRRAPSERPADRSAER
jgi:UDP-N-acetylglucosamine 2-epimerase (non-hydrolysing)